MHTEKFIKKMITIESIVSCFDADYKNPFYFSGEFHPFWEMVYVKEGSLNVSGDEKVYRLQKGDIIFHKPMEFHRIWSEHGADIHAFIIAFRADGKLMSGFENRALTLGDRQIRELEEIRRFAKTNFAENHGRYHITMFKSWKELSDKIQILTNMLENFLLSMPTEGDITEKTTDNAELSKLYKMMIELLNDNVYRWITLDDVANKCGFSKSQIKRVFALYSDIGIHKYFLKLKVATAIHLLGKGETVSDIAEKLSFNSQNYFSTVFKRETGLSPTDYKKKLL